MRYWALSWPYDHFWCATSLSHKHRHLAAQLNGRVPHGDTEVFKTSMSLSQPHDLFCYLKKKNGCPFCGYSFHFLIFSTVVLQGGRLIASCWVILNEINWSDAEVAVQYAKTADREFLWFLSRRQIAKRRFLWTIPVCMLFCFVFPAATTTLLILNESLVRCRLSGREEEEGEEKTIYSLTSSSHLSMHEVLMMSIGFSRSSKRQKNRFII